MSSSISSSNTYDSSFKVFQDFEEQLQSKAPLVKVTVVSINRRDYHKSFISFLNQTNENVCFQANLLYNCSVTSTRKIKFPDDMRFGEWVYNKSLLIKSHKTAISDEIYLWRHIFLADDTIPSDYQKMIGNSHLVIYLLTPESVRKDLLLPLLELLNPPRIFTVCDSLVRDGTLTPCPLDISSLRFKIGEDTDFFCVRLFEELDKASIIAYVEKCKIETCYQKFVEYKKETFVLFQKIHTEYETYRIMTKYLEVLQENWDKKDAVETIFDKEVRKVALLIEAETTPDLLRLFNLVTGTRTIEFDNKKVMINQFLKDFYSVSFDQMKVLIKSNLPDRINYIFKNILSSYPEGIDVLEKGLEFFERKQNVKEVISKVSEEKFPFVSDKFAIDSFISTHLVWTNNYGDIVSINHLYKLFSQSNYPGYNICSSEVFRNYFSHNYTTTCRDFVLKFRLQA